MTINHLSALRPSLGTPANDPARSPVITAAGGEGDGHPGTPWTPPQEPPSPDGDTPPGDGTHRK
ncbi:hypothetical protein ACFVWX_19380 [Streptomyces sp. NPDC058220]|uniref:hypothetical protein n=1 Tax=Streptomyces sp. NPDC058220 TaxID=3346387 RepID=UPI0036EBB2DE